MKAKERKRVFWKENDLPKVYVNFSGKKSDLSNRMSTALLPIEFINEFHWVINQRSVRLIESKKLFANWHS